MILIRFILISLIVYLIIRSFLKFGDGKESSSQPGGPDNANKQPSKRVSKEIGEYIDYEEIKK